MMKKFIVVLALVLAMLTLLSCATDEPASGDDATWSFVYNGATITPGEEFAAVSEKLGEPSGYYEAASCAFDGKDKIYTYGSLQISVSPLDGADIIYMVTLLDDSLATPEGICVGAQKSAVINAYGKGEDKGSSVTYRKGKVDLVFLIRDDCVTSVQYRYVDAVIES
ncbi:MAG: hypothetical protein IJY27_04045 [Clostridia bacterium]|nr:hypothetical protein [Clostridia bacterium]